MQTRQQYFKIKGGFMLMQMQEFFYRKQTAKKNHNHKELRRGGKCGMELRKNIAVVTKS